MAGKDKPLKDAVKALGDARDALANAGAARANATAAALAACEDLAKAGDRLSVALTESKAFDRVAKKLKDIKAASLVLTWAQRERAAAKAQARQAAVKFELQKQSAAKAFAELRAAENGEREAFGFLKDSVARIPPESVVPGAVSKLPDELLQVIRGGKEDRSNYLTISQRDARFDPLVRDTLGQLGRESRNAFEPELMKKIVAEGLASDVEKITRRINRMGMPDLRRSVLAETYAELLHEALDDGGSLSRERAADTVGTGEAVIAALDGKLDRFAAILATRTATALGLDAPDGSYSHSIIKARVLGQI